MAKFDSDKAEILAKWYLRFNGYFIIDNFVIHAGDDSGHKRGSPIRQYTETDLLALRMRHSKEITGHLEIKNDTSLIHKGNPFIDFIIVEVKTGKKDHPNDSWSKMPNLVFPYILRFAGFLAEEKKINEVSDQLLERGAYLDPDEKFAVRLLMISEIKPNKRWQHITHVSIESIIDFLVAVRGQCWIENEMGTRSLHDQWDPLLKEIFEIANNTHNDFEGKKRIIRELLQAS